MINLCYANSLLCEKRPALGRKLPSFRHCCHVFYFLILKIPVVSLPFE